MDENKYSPVDKETRPGERKELDHLIKGWKMPDTHPHHSSDSFLLWFLPQFIQHVGEVMVGVSLCRFIWDAELYMNRIPELIQLIIPK